MLTANEMCWNMYDRRSIRILYPCILPFATEISCTSFLPFSLWIYDISYVKVGNSTHSQGNCCLGNSRVQYWVRGFERIWKGSSKLLHASMVLMPNFLERILIWNQQTFLLTTLENWSLRILVSPGSNKGRIITLHWQILETSITAHHPSNRELAGIANTTFGLWLVSWQKSSSTWDMEWTLWIHLRRIYKMKIILRRCLGLSGSRTKDAIFWREVSNRFWRGSRIRKDWEIRI